MQQSCWSFRRMDLENIRLEVTPRVNEQVKDRVGDEKVHKGMP